MRRLAVAGLAGTIFAVGLGISGMTDPRKVLGFLDLFGGRWDPSLGCVMAGAIAVHMPIALWWRRRARGSAHAAVPPPPAALESAPTVERAAERPTEDDGPSDRRARVNPRLVVGAAIFGVGWGLGGYCPGPAIVTLVGFSPGILVFAASMMMGMWLFHLLSSRDAPTAPPRRRPGTVTALPWVGNPSRD
jgi:uncharacterized membrane protein YedE/YeeE